MPTQTSRLSLLLLTAATLTTLIGMPGPLAASSFSPSEERQGTLDMSVIRKAIRDGLASQIHLENVAVVCPPETRALKEGDTFDCDGKPQEGGHLVVNVTQKDDQGNIDWNLTKIEGFLNLTTVEEAIVTGIKEQADTDATVSCGGGVKKLRVSKPGDTFDCTATTPDGAARTVKVTVKDTDGNISWALE